MTQSHLALSRSTEGRYCLVGEMTHQTVLSVMNKNLHFSQQGKTVLDFSGVKRSDSAGLALMVHWARSAKQANASICFEQVPEKLLALAKMSGLNTILSISAA